MALACTATPAEPTPSGPILPEAEALSVVKDRWAKTPLGDTSCLFFLTLKGDLGHVKWDTTYLGNGVWKITPDRQEISRGLAIPERTTQTDPIHRVYKLFEKTRIVESSADMC